MPFASPRGRRLKFLLGAGVLVGAALVLLRTVRSLRLAEIGQALAQVPTRDLLLCGLLTAISFVVLGVYDVLALRVVARGRVSRAVALLAGISANAVSNTIGFHAVTSTTVRYRVYRKAGLSLAEVVAVASLSWASLGFGFLTMLALALLFQAGSGFADAHAVISFSAALGIFAALAILVRWLGGGRTIARAGLVLALPAGGVALCQMALGALEMTAAIGALYVLMPPGAVPPYLAFSGAYVLAVLLGIVSHAPGGLGVFEAAMLSLSGTDDRAGVLAALLLYRVIYNFLPFILATSALLLHGVLARRQFERG